MEQKYKLYDQIVAKVVTNIINELNYEDGTYANIILYIGGKPSAIDFCLYECCKIAQTFLNNDIKFYASYKNLRHFKKTLKIKKSLYRVGKRGIPNITYLEMKKALKDIDENLSFEIFNEIYNAYWRK